MPKNTSNARFRQVVSEIWPSKVSWLLGPVYARPGLICARQGPVVAQPACVVARRDPSMPAHMSFETKKLLEAISHSKLVQIERLRCFLASTFPIDAKKHLKLPIWTSFEWDMAFQSFLTFGTRLRATKTRRRATCLRHRATRPVCARPHEFWD